MKKVTAYAPASIANFNVGFDALGVAFDHLGDEVSVWFNDTNENKIVDIINGNGLPYELHKNCCSVVIQKMQESIGMSKGVDILIKKGIRSCSGLGSSSASSAAAAVAFNRLIDEPFDEKELVLFAAEGESVASGTVHMDNVAPAVLGGIVLIKGNTKNDIISLPTPKELYATVLFPEIKIKTSKARNLIQDHIPTKNAIRQASLMGAFVSGLYRNDWELISSSMIDLIAEPVRANLIPHFQEMKDLTLKNGAIAFGISGSGPTIFALSKDEGIALNLQSYLTHFYSSTEINFDTYIGPLTDNNGARIIE